jgi:hypothetical protein
MDTLSNVSLQKVIHLMAIYIHEQAVDIRKNYVIEDGTLKIFSDYVVYPTDDNHYYAFHYCVHVDNETERFFIVTWTPSNEDEYLDSLKY